MGEKLRNIIWRIRGLLTCCKKTSNDIDVVLKRIDKDISEMYKSPKT